MQRPSLVTTTFVGYVASNASLALNNSEVKRGTVETYLQIGSCGRERIAQPYGASVMVSAVQQGNTQYMSLTSCHFLFFSPFCPAWIGGGE